MGFSNAMTLMGEWVSRFMWASSNKQERIIRNIPCHTMEYSQYIHLPCVNNIWHDKIFHTLSWNILPCHMWSLEVKDKI
jgi:hypothetical protein